MKTTKDQLQQFLTELSRKDLTVLLSQIYGITNLLLPFEYWEHPLQTIADYAQDEDYKRSKIAGIETKRAAAQTG